MSLGSTPKKTIADLFRTLVTAQLRGVKRQKSAASTQSHARRNPLEHSPSNSKCKAAKLIERIMLSVVISEHRLLYA